MIAVGAWLFGSALGAAAVPGGLGALRVGPDTVAAAEGSVGEAEQAAAELEQETARPPRPEEATGRSAPPRPGQAGGLAVPPRQGARPLLWVPRVLLFVPRYAVDMATHPFRLGIMAVEQYRLPERATDLFFNDERTFGIYPGVLVETGFGFNVGLHLVHRDLFRKGERLALDAGYGGLYRQRYSASLSTGRRLGDVVELQLFGTFRIVPKARFFGIGDADQGGVGAAEVPLPPIDPPTAVETSYRRDEASGALQADVRLAPRLRMEVLHMWTWRRFLDSSSSSSPELDRVYDTRRLTGWRTGQSTAYAQGALVLDTTEVAGPHISPATPSRGWLVRGWFGGALGVGDDPNRHIRYGVDLQRFIDLYRGDRVLRLRALFDVVGADFDRIDFVDLPSLGGPNLLRGYVRGRFRGRIAGLATAEYTWPIDRMFSGFLFCDLGRVWNGFPLRGPRPRVGFGGGLVLFNPRGFLARVQVAGSGDGGVFVQLRFSPSWEMYDGEA